MRPTIGLFDQITWTSGRCRSNLSHFRLLPARDSLTPSGVTIPNMDERDFATVLVVEDDPYQAIWLTRVLERAGYDVVGPACDEVTALQLIGENPPDVAVIDIDLSGSSRSHRPGVVRTSAQVAMALADWNVPFVVVTSHDRVALLNAVGRAAPRLVKPVQEAQLLDAVSGAGLSPAC